jgi:hypothetical protein
MRLVRSVREIQTDDIDAGNEQRTQRVRGTAGRAERGDDFGVSHGLIHPGIDDSVASGLD